MNSHINQNCVSFIRFFRGWNVILVGILVGKMGVLLSAEQGKVLIRYGDAVSFVFLCVFILFESNFRLKKGSKADLVGT